MNFLSFIKTSYKEEMRGSECDVVEEKKIIGLQDISAKV
jgi:hypothetical protein